MASDEVEPEAGLSLVAPLALPQRFDDDDLVLRVWTATDAPALHEAITRNVEHLRPWMPWIAFEPQAVHQREELIARWAIDAATGGDVVLGAFLDGTVVGGTGLHRRIGPDGLEIGYWIDRDHVGRGLATRVSRVLTSGAFAVDGITHVEIHCDVANAASARVPEKLGFTYVGDVERPVLAPSETGSHRVYRMLHVNWVRLTAK